MNQLSLVPACDKCGGPKKQVKAKENKSGFRWRCQSCQAAFAKSWKQQVDWNAIQRERYEADPDRKQAILDRNQQWRQENQEWLESYSQQPERRRNNRRYTKNSNLKRNYGITIDDYEAKLLAQGGKCVICGATHTAGKRSEMLCVDHCHEGGQLRDLLCKPCNTGLGCFGDDIGRLLAAVEYLKRHGMGAATS